MTRAAPLPLSPARATLGRAALASAVLAAATLPLAAQAPAGLPLLPEAEEILLARSAAPPAIADDADVWVLRASGLERAVEGTNGWTCFVDRDDPRTLAPQCFDPEGTRALLPGVRALFAAWSRSGDFGAAAGEVARRTASGELPSPGRPVLSYMLSPGQRLVAEPGGRAIGAWKPHLMIFWPGLTAEAMGVPGDSPHVTVNAPGGPLSYLILPVDRWSDGSLAGSGGR